MQYRHEIKFEISPLDMIVLRSRLNAIMKKDEHTIDGKYHIRSLYFDTPNDKALKENLDGMITREKFRIRLYNHDESTLHLERKFKHIGLGYKNNAYLSKQEVESIISGNIKWMKTSEDPLLNYLYHCMLYQQLKPKVIVDYKREPFVYMAGNVRITLDYDIKTSMQCIDLLNPYCIMVPIANACNILEVKYDNFLPQVIHDALQLGNRKAQAFSKYANSRMYD